MDKRSLLFILCVTATLFLVNIFFSYYDHQKKREWLAQRQAYEAQQAVMRAEEFDARRVTAQQLPVTIAYRDDAAAEPYGVAVVTNGLIVVQQQGDKLPSQLFTSKNGKTKAYSLLRSGKAPGAPALYGLGPDLPAIRLNELGIYDLQMVHLIEGEQGPTIEVRLAEYRDGMFTNLEGLSGDALALSHGDDGFLAAGVYTAADGQFLPLEDVSTLADMVSLPEVPAIEAAADEKFFVLENEYLQLVFSSRGGALVENNLPLADEEHPDRPVKILEVDRDLLRNSPANARFPQHPYTIVDANGQRVEHEQGSLGGYYPLLRRDLFLHNGMVKTVEPRHYALNIVSDYPEVAQLLYTVVHHDSRKLVLQAVQPHRRITKTYTLPSNHEAAPYVFDVEIKIDGDSRGLWLTTGVPEVEMVSGNSTPTLKFRQQRADKVEVSKISLPKDTTTVTSTQPDWLCNSNGFFGIILDPLSTIDTGYQVRHVAGPAMPTRLTQVDASRYNAAKLPGYNMLLPLSNKGGVMRFRVFAGPFAEQTLKAVDTAFSDSSIGYNPQYIASRTFHGWFSFVSEPIAKFLLVVMKMIHRLTHSWALSIILLTVVLRGLLYPLNSWSMKSMRRMQQVAPVLQKIQEKYKKDPKRLQKETMEIYRKHGVNPASGCFPMLLQLPFLIGMFDLLRSTFELRGATFIPGWIDDLSSPDVLFSWDFSLPLIGNEFHLLPILLGGIMYVQSRWMSSAPKDPNTMTDAQKQQKMMGTFMPLLFTFMFYNFASGLNLYWLSSTALGILQQWVINKQLQGEGATKK